MEDKEILMLFGTQTGNAERVGEICAERLGDAGLRVHFVDMLDAYPEMLQDYTEVVLITSTWGDGELPDNALDFFESLLEVRPDCSHQSFCVIGLGDHVYDPHFCEAATRLHDTWTSLGATALAANYEIDAGPTDDDIAGAYEYLWHIFGKREKGFQ